MQWGPLRLVATGINIFAVAGAEVEIHLLEGTYAGKILGDPSGAQDRLVGLGLSGHEGRVDANRRLAHRVWC